MIDVKPKVDFVIRSMIQFSDNNISFPMHMCLDADV